MQFNDNSYGKRKWQCFVCGVQFKNYDEYKNHIIGTHDEVREFIRCPDCGAPVREMRSHYKTKHPNRVMPTSGPMKVSVWYDFSDGKRRTRKPKFKDGYFVSNKMGGKRLHYRSGYESEVYQLLEGDNDVRAFFAEPFKVPYTFEGQWLEYIPDLRVEFTDGGTEIWEIKPATQTGIEKNRAKWAAMEAYANQMGWRFVVVTEVGINKLKRKITESNSIGIVDN